MVRKEVLRALDGHVPPDHRVEHRRAVLPPDLLQVVQNRRDLFFWNLESVQLNVVEYQRQVLDEDPRQLAIGDESKGNAAAPPVTTCNFFLL